MLSGTSIAHVARILRFLSIIISYTDMLYIRSNLIESYFFKATVISDLVLYIYIYICLVKANAEEFRSPHRSVIISIESLLGCLAIFLSRNGPKHYTKVIAFKCRLLFLCIFKVVSIRSM